jgi:hypothetical protein
MAKAIALGALAILLLLLAPSGPARSDDAAPSRCSEGRGFSLDEPEGWMCKRTSDDESETVEQVAIWPAQGAGTLAIDLTMVADAAPKVTAEQVVERAISHRLVPPEPPDVLPFEAAHPRLRTAGGAVRMSRGEMYAVALEGRRDAGAYFVALFTKTSGPATDEELALFRRTIRSVRVTSLGN